MEFVVIACGGCGKAIRTRRHQTGGDFLCERCGRDRNSLGPEPVLAAPREDHAESAQCARRSSILAPVLALILLPSLLMVAWDRASDLSAGTPGVFSAASAAGRHDPPPGSLAAEPVALSPPAPAVSRETGASRPAPPPDELLEVPSAVRQPQAQLPVKTPDAAPDDPAANRPRPVLEPVAVRRSLPPPRPLELGSVGNEADAPAFGGASARQFMVRDEEGRPVVARLHGQSDGKTVLILPDGQLGVPNMLVPTTRPFRPLTAEELLPRLRNGPLGEFDLHQTSHYLIFYRSSRSFAESSGRLLEDLYQRLLEAFQKNNIPVHESEFPLVAVIYPTEKAFRAAAAVDPEVQAFYEIYTNRIHFYESSEHDDRAPEVTALRRPQTVAHEGTHQILQNIGVHPRLSSWPTWLVEGLAEYCATPACSRKGPPAWDGLGMINGLHMATIRELEDPLSVSVRGRDVRSRSLVRAPGQPLVEALIRRTRLTPTEYALAWAMTHYLAFKRQDDFVAYLRTMSQVAPLEEWTPEMHLAAFRTAFGADLARIDRSIDGYLKKLAKQKGYDPMPYYAVMFEQPLPAGVLRRAVMVSQSPQIIHQWVQEIVSPTGGPPTWQALPHPTRARAIRAAEDWMHLQGG